MFASFERLRCFSVSLCVFVCAGCASPIDKKGGLAKVWGERLQQYRIIPVFPPREDIQVGDIYLACVPKGYVDPNVVQLNGESNTPLWVSSLSSLFGDGKPLKNFYENRIDLPSSASAIGVGTSQSTKYNGLIPIPESQTMFTKGTSARMRNVSFPEFFSVKAFGGSLSGLLPNSSMLVGAGFSAENLQSASISIPVAESYGIPALEFESALGLLDTKSLTRMSALVAPSENSKEASPYELDCSGTKALIGVTEIFAARAIDVNFEFKSSAAAKVNAALSIEGTRKTVFDALKNVFSPVQVSMPGGATTTTTPLATSDPDKAAALLESLKQLLQSVEGSMHQDYPGVKVSFHSGSSSGITMKREFMHPVVVGYRGVRIYFGQGPDKKIAASIAALKGTPSDYLVGDDAEEPKVEKNPNARPQK